MPPASLRNARRMLASSTSSIVFQSPARRPVFGRGIGDAIPPGNGGRPGGPPARAPAAGGAGFGGGNATRKLSAARPSQPFFRCLRALAIERHAIRGEVAFVQRHEDALQAAVGRPLGAQQHAGLAARRASERGEDSDVLIGPIRQQPAAGRGCRRADDLAVLGAPGALSDRLPTGEARTGENDVRREILRRAVDDGRQMLPPRWRPPRATFRVDAS